MTHALVIVCGYNCPDFLAQCLASIEVQDYPDLSVVVVDDASTNQMQRDMVEALNDRAGWTGVVNAERVYATANIWHAIKEVARPNPDDLVVLVDADDWLSAKDSVSRIVAEFEWDPNMWVGYGSYVPIPLDVGCEPAAPYPIDVIRDRSFRTHTQLYNHPLAARAFMFDELPESELRDDDGDWVRFQYDQALMSGLLEMAGPNHRHMGAVTYAYRSNSPSACNLNNGDEMRRVGAELAARPKLPRYYRDQFATSSVERSETVLTVMAEHDARWLVLAASGFDTMRDELAASTAVDGVVSVVADFNAYHAATEATIGTNVRMIHGDDVDWFRRVAHGLHHRAVWFLDGERYGGPASVLDELHVVLARGRGDVVLLDDARLFGVRAGLPSVDAIRGHVDKISAETGRAYSVSVEYDVVHVTPKGDG